MIKPIPYDSFAYMSGRDTAMMGRPRYAPAGFGAAWYRGYDDALKRRRINSFKRRWRKRWNDFNSLVMQTWNTCGWFAVVVGIVVLALVMKADGL